jgi:NitT/TauT family transport system ATP-binding protein
MNNKLLEIINLNKTYHTKENDVIALKDVSFDVYKNEFISIVGPSGCGKSTILSILSGLESKSSGDIILKPNISIGYMLQDDCLFFWKTILDNCLVGLEINGSLNDESYEYVISLLKTYGLYDFKDMYPSSLSGGMRQRVALIRTLALKPDILLLDEPMSALDAQSRLAIGNDIYNIIKKESKTAIMVTHDLAEAISMSDRIILLTKRPGKIKNIYNIELDEKNCPIKNRSSKNFSYYYENIWEDLNGSD